MSQDDANDKIDLTEIAQRVQQAQAGWIPGTTSILQLPPEQRRRRLGYVPGPNEPTLAQREMAAAASEAVRMAAPLAAGAAYPTSFDWRNVNGSNYVTPIKDQGNCGSCVAFGTAATVESAALITEGDPGLLIDISEAQLFFCYAQAQGRNCGNGWWVDPALNSFLSGVTQQACYPYSDHDQNCTNLCSNWKDTATYINAQTSLTSTDDMKQWIANNGPLVSCFTVYSDFYSYKSGVYRHVSGTLEGGHCISVVGYDDTQQCWICKNSWGTGWGENGFFQIAYGQVGIDAQMWGVTGVHGIVLPGKVVLGDTSTQTPALASVLVNGNNAKLAIAWAGTDSSSTLNVMTSSDGRNFGNKVTLAENSPAGPDMTFFAGRTYLAWIGTDDQHHINLASSSDCQTFDGKVTLDEASNFSPAVAASPDRLFLAWTGTDSDHHINVMSSTDGTNFGNKVTLSDLASAAPALTFHNGTLYLVWSGTDSDHHLNIMQSTDGVNFTNKVTLGDTSSFQAGVEMSLGNALYLAWTGRDGEQYINSLNSTSGTQNFGDKVTYLDTATAGLSLAAFANNLYIAWSGTDGEHHLNVAPIA